MMEASFVRYEPSRKATISSDETPFQK